MHTQKPNHLSRETSPYLQQHRYNPVDWYPWSQEALQKARDENKPILLSIGYAACHWCHVMAHESFEDEETAKLMNELFVNIKVDREERPDLDKIYQTAHHLLTQSSGGWPLTVFLTPDDHTPFFSGTYFPREARYQLPSFKDVLRGIADAYQKRPEDIKKQNQELNRILQHTSPVSETNVNLGNQPLKHADAMLQQYYDPTHGGFGRAPKFPQPTMLELLLQQQSPMASTTLRKMAEGGIYDQLRGGFYRYAVDAEWKIPHFEKMLYDNGQLLFLYALAANLFNETFFAVIAHETAQWVLAEMQSKEGGYYSSLNADSEGHEGKFYIWDKSEIEKLLPHKEFEIAARYFGLDQPPNFEGQWHLFIAKPETIPSSIKQKLLAAREKRVHPTRDEKILTSWNALMIKGMLVAGDILQKPEYFDSAQRALDFIYKNLWKNNWLLASYKDKNAYLPAYLDDHVFLLDALLTSLQISWNTKYLNWAVKLADILLDDFQNQDNGGFFFTSRKHEKLLYRPKTFLDEAIPSGNGVAVRALITLGHLLGETRYLDAAEKALSAAWPALLEYPAEHSSLLMGLKSFLEPHQTIVIRGPEKEINMWRDYCKSRDPIYSDVFAIPSSEPNLPPALAARNAESKTCAYICKGTACSAAIYDLEKLKVS